MERDVRLFVSAIPCCTSTFPAAFHELRHHPISAPFVLRAPRERSQQNNCSKPRLIAISYLPSIICGEIKAKRASVRVHDAGPNPSPSFAIADPEADPALKHWGGL